MGPKNNDKSHHSKRPRPLLSARPGIDQRQRKPTNGILTSVIHKFFFERAVFSADLSESIFTAFLYSFLSCLRPFCPGNPL